MPFVLFKSLSSVVMVVILLNNLLDALPLTRQENKALTYRSNHHCLQRMSNSNGVTILIINDKLVGTRDSNTDDSIMVIKSEETGFAFIRGWKSQKYLCLNEKEKWSLHDDKEDGNCKFVEEIVDGFMLFSVSINCTGEQNRTKHLKYYLSIKNKTETLNGVPVMTLVKRQTDHNSARFLLRDVKNNGVCVPKTALPDQTPKPKANTESPPKNWKPKKSRVVCLKPDEDSTE